LLALGAACSDETTTPILQSSQFNGTWSFTETLQDTVWNVGASCEGIGTLVISNANTTFTGTLSLLGARSQCVDDSGAAYVKPGSSDLTDRVVSGNRISFRTDTCSYDGGFVGQFADSLAGTVSCSWMITAGQAEFVGTWHGGR
jgi:hypothetical protein